MNMSAIAAACDRSGAVSSSISRNIAGIKAHQRAAHLPHKLHIFSNGGAMAHPTAQSAQYSSPVFLYRFAIVIGSGCYARNTSR